MKKLMIAAAAVAMIGGAYADTAYTFSASLKTTKGKDGKDVVPYNLGKCKDGERPDWATGNFWYNAVEVENAVSNYPAYFTWKTVGGSKVLALTSKAKKDTDFLYNDLKLKDLAKVFDQPSAGKWCETVKVTEYDCYRVAGTKKISDIIAGDFCCSGLKTVADDGVEVSADLTQYFGSLSQLKASKAELFAKVEDDVTRFVGYAAGQGTVGNVLDSDDLTVQNRGITSISGNIVGILPAVECEYCCYDPTPAIAFECGADEGDDSLGTAAYGTFKIKYNKKATLALAVVEE